MPETFDYSTPGSENVTLLNALINDETPYTEDTHSRNAEILKSIINNTEYTDAPQSEIEELLLELKEKIGGEVEIDELNVTENGTYSETGKAYSPVNVNVQPELITKTITANGTYNASSDDADGYSSVTVNVEGYAKKSIANTPTPIATFNASALPMPSLTVSIEAVQSGSGDPSPTNVRPISGWSAVNVYRTGKNLIPITCNTQTKQGVTYTVYKNEDGAVTRIHAEGTATASHSFTVVEGYTASNPFMVKAGSYWFKGISNGESGKFDFNIRKLGESSDIVQRTDKVSLELSEDTYFQSCYLYIYSGTTINTDIYPMIWLKSLPNDDFEPYSKTTYTTALKDGQGNPMVCYGGTLSNENGVQSLTNNTIRLSLADVCTYVQDFGNYKCFYSDNLSTLGIIEIPSSSEDFIGASDTYKMMAYNSIMIETNNSIAVRSDNTRKAIYVRTDGTDTTTPTGYAVLQLATPQQIPQDNLPISTQEGTNNLWADSGDIQSGEYMEAL